MANNAALFQAQVDLNTQLLNQQAQQLVIDQGKADLLTLLILRPDSAIAIKDTILVDRTMNYNAVVNDIKTNPDIKAAYDQISINKFWVKEIGSQR